MQSKRRHTSRNCKAGIRIEGREEHSPLTRESQTMPTNRQWPPILQPPSYLHAGVFASSLVRAATSSSTMRWAKLLILLSKKLEGTQPLGLLGLVKVSKLDLLHPRLVPVFLVTALGRNESEHDATHLWRRRDAVFEARACFLSCLAPPWRGGASQRPRPRSGPGKCQGQPRFCQP